MTDGLSTSIFQASPGDQPEITAVIYVGPTLSFEDNTLEVLQTLPEFAEAFRPDHALNIKSVQDHTPFLEVLHDPERLPIIQERLREDLPTHGRCLFFLPSLNASPEAAVDLAPLTQALQDTGFKAIEMIITASDPDAEQPLGTHAARINWPYQITTRSFEELPVVYRGVLGSEAVVQACVKLCAACDAVGLEYDWAGLNRAVTTHLIDIHTAGLRISPRSQTHMAELMFAKMCQEFGLDPAA